MSLSTSPGVRFAVAAASAFACLFLLDTLWAECDNQVPSGSTKACHTPGENEWDGCGSFDNIGNPGATIPGHPNGLTYRHACNNEEFQWPPGDPDGDTYTFTKLEVEQFPKECKQEGPSCNFNCDEPNANCYRRIDCQMNTSGACIAVPGSGGLWIQKPKKTAERCTSS